MRMPNFRLPVLLTCAALISFTLAACTGTGATSSPGTDEHMDMTADYDKGGDPDHPEHTHHEVPDEYKDLTNPLAGDSGAISSGGRLFIANCATCHGENGDGDGPAGAGLDPEPAALSDGDMLSDVSDAYLFWRISEGGASAPFNSAMPSWRGAFGEEQIWQLVTFIRSLSN